MISRSEVMKEAHRIRRWLLKTYAPWQIARGVIDVSMSRCLSAAWRNVKEAVANLVEPVLTEAQKLDQQIAAMTVEAKSFRYSVRNERAALSTNHFHA